MKAKASPAYGRQSNLPVIDFTAWWIIASETEGPVRKRASWLHLLKFFFLAWVILIFMMPMARAATNVSGSIRQDTTWTLAGSPYVVTNDVIVYGSSTSTAKLTIEAGVEVRFNPGKGLNIGDSSNRGALLAQGQRHRPSSSRRTHRHRRGATGGGSISAMLRMTARRFWSIVLWNTGAVQVGTMPFSTCITPHRRSRAARSATAATTALPWKAPAPRRRSAVKGSETPS